MSSHQPCYVCGHDFVGPDIGFGVNLCDTCRLRYGELHAEIKQLQVRVDAAESNFRTEHNAVIALEDLAETAWGIIANAYGGNWDSASEASGWKAAGLRVAGVAGHKKGNRVW